MNKGTGFVTVGATLIAGMMFQFKTGTTPNTDQHKLPHVASATESTSGEGPWLASCSYWSAARPQEASSQPEPSPQDVTIAQTDGVRLQLKPSEEKATCGSLDWGIPKHDEPDTEITTIVATVPDPIHSHLALDFDRSIDAILLAAVDNHYVSSFYWLPWRSQIGDSSTGESVSTTVKPADADSKRERQPGLIILRYTPDTGEWENRSTNGFKWTNYRRVIYLFLVGETPSLGVNGDQLQKAFAYEKLLQKDFHASLSIPYWTPHRSAETPTEKSSAAGKPSPTAINQTAKAPGNQQPEETGGTNNPNPQYEEPCASSPTVSKVSILGPFYSGSASSLHAGIEAAFPDPKESCVSISGVTSTAIAARELDPEGKHIYRSFGENIAFEQERFLRSLDARGYDLSRVAMLSEALTVFGSNATRPMKNEPGGTILYLRFPRELSLLRNAQANRPDPSAPPTPYLNLSLKDYTADDTVPRFSANQSPLSIEAQLMAIAHQLQHARSQFILISASNVLDDIFLAQFLHRACPDARLVILSGGDLLFERDAENAPYIGSISISPYLLSSLDFGEHVQWLHAGYQAEAIYNAASFTFWHGPYSGPPQLTGYRSYPSPRKTILPLQSSSSRSLSGLVSSAPTVTIPSPFSTGAAAVSTRSCPTSGRQTCSSPPRL